MLRIVIPQGYPEVLAASLIAQLLRHNVGTLGELS